MAHKPQRELPGISSVSHFEALNHDIFYPIHDTNRTEGGPERKSAAS